MQYLSATTVAILLGAASTAALGAEPDCAIGYVSGVGGAEQSYREYVATPDSDKYRYIADHPIQCKVSDEGHASDCNGVTSLRHEKVSVYDDIDDKTMAVVVRVELDRGTYPVIIDVAKQAVQCEK